jgi:hypothetical protein
MANSNTMPGQSGPGLIGHWLLYPEPNTDNGLTGQIVTSVGDYHLVKMRGDSGYSRLLTSDTLCAADTYLFDSEAQLDAWLSWEPPDGFDGPRVVPIRKGV